MKKDEKRKEYSQQLRSNATPEENTLWYQYLRRYPVQFRRQCVVGPYILDFYCAKALLAVELDGSQHYETPGRKKMRKEADIWKPLASMCFVFPIQTSNRIYEVSAKRLTKKCKSELHRTNQVLVEQPFLHEKYEGVKPLIRPLRGHLPPRGKVKEEL